MGTIKNKPIVDTRGEGALITALKGEGIECEEKALKVGDIQYENFIGERKTLEDFVSSLLDGSLFDQAFRLAEIRGESGEDYITAFLISGNEREVRKRLYKVTKNARIKQARVKGKGVSRIKGMVLNSNAIHEAIASLVVRYGHLVIWEQDTAGLAKTIKAMMRKIDEGKIGKPHPRNPRKRYVSQDVIVSMVMKIYKLSEKNARSILDTYKTISTIMSLEPEEVMELKIKGIGPRTKENMILTNELLGKMWVQ